MEPVGFPGLPRPPGCATSCAQGVPLLAPLGARRRTQQRTDVLGADRGGRGESCGWLSAAAGLPCPKDVAASIPLISGAGVATS